MNKTPSASTSKTRAGKTPPRRKDNDGARASVGDAEQSRNQIDDAVRRAMIAEGAYYRAERRGFAPGFELEDWLLSENELEGQSPNQIERESLERSTSSSAELH